MTISAQVQLRWKIKSYGSAPVLQQLWMGTRIVRQDADGIHKEWVREWRDVPTVTHHEPDETSEPYETPDILKGHEDGKS